MSKLKLNISFNLLGLFYTCRNSKLPIIMYIVLHEIDDAVSIYINKKKLFGI